MNIAILLENTARSFGDRPALCSGDRVHADYQAFRRTAGALAAGLRDALGVVPGDRVALAMANRPAFYEAMWGTWHAGACAVPMNAKLHALEFAYILDNSGAKACLVGPELEDTFSYVAR